MVDSAPSSAPGRSVGRQLPPARRWAFRCAAILLGLSPFLVGEATLRLIDWQPPGAVADPYVGFSEIRPLFERSDDGKRFQIAANRKPLFCADSFLAAKPARGFRVFCIGGSTVQGRPFAIETSFSTWLELSLENLVPQRDIEVINCGGVSYASYRLVPIVEEILDHQPDLVVLYTGHNEFLEDRTYQSVRQTPAAIAAAHDRLSRSRLYTWLRNQFVVAPNLNPNPNSDSKSASDGRFELPAEVEARLDFQGGLNQYHRDDDWRDRVAAHFELNLDRMVTRIQQRGVPLLLFNPVSNLRDCQPFKSEHGAELTADQRQQVEQALNATERKTVPSLDQLKADRERLSEAVAIDPRHALLHFRLGQTESQLAQRDGQSPGVAVSASSPAPPAETAPGYAHFLRAKEEDVCPLRMLESMHESVFEISRRRSVPLLDARDWFRGRSKDGMVGQESLVDHVHPSIAGHQQLARLIVERLASDRDLIAETGLNLTRDRVDDVALQANIDAAYQRHLSDLPFLYFELGKDQLEGLRRWSAGEVRRRRGAKRQPGSHHHRRQTRDRQPESGDESGQ